MLLRKMSCAVTYMCHLIERVVAAKCFCEDGSAKYCNVNDNMQQIKLRQSEIRIMNKYCIKKKKKKKKKKKIFSLIFIFYLTLATKS
jgi:spore coat polysaccharide biosynthesis predicted glycosyltransferase SpsG